MNFLRRLALALSASIFSIAIFLFATMLSFFMVFGTPKHIETALSQSGIYNNAGQFLLEKNQNKGDNTLPLTNPTVKAAVKDSVPAATVEREANKVLDSTYAWAEGKTQSPNFTIDLTEIKNSISTNIGTSLTAKLQALPICPAGTVIPTNTAAILSLTCRPANVPVAKLVEQVEQQAEGKGVMSDSSITAQSIKNSDGQPVFDQLHRIPQLYKTYVQALYALPVLALLTALGVIFLSHKRRAGVRRVGVTLVTTGIYAGILALLALWLMHHYADKLSGQVTDMASLQANLVYVIRTLADNVRHYWLIFGISYLVVGGIIWLLTHVIRQRKTHEAISNPLSHNMDIPTAGTTFEPKAPESHHKSVAVNQDHTGHNTAHDAKSSETSIKSEEPKPETKKDLE